MASTVYLAGQVADTGGGQERRRADAGDSRDDRRLAGRGRLGQDAYPLGDDLSRRHRDLRRDERGVGRLGRAGRIRRRARRSKPSSPRRAYHGRDRLHRRQGRQKGTIKTCTTPADGGLRGVSSASRRPRRRSTGSPRSTTQAAAALRARGRAVPARRRSARPRRCARASAIPNCASPTQPEGVPPSSARAFAKFTEAGVYVDDGDAAARISAPICSSSSSRWSRNSARRSKSASARRRFPTPTCSRAATNSGAAARRRRARALLSRALAGRGRRRDRRRRVRVRPGFERPLALFDARARRLFAAPARPLHRLRLARDAALDAADQLPPLRRPVRALGPRAVARPAPSNKLVLPGNVVIDASADARGGRGAGGRRRLAPLPDAGLSPRARRRARRQPGQHRRRARQRQDHHRPSRGAAPALLADGRPLRRPAAIAAHRRLRAGPRLSAPGPHPRRRGAAGHADPGARRSAGRAAGGGRARSPASAARR